jgi:outer membrane receptor protein involved in Fe transport
MTQAAVHPASPGCLCHRVAVSLAMSLLSFAPLLVFANPQAGQLLRDALLELNGQGAGLLFSSELVTADMRVMATPTPAEPSQIATEIIAPFGLVLLRAPGGRWLVARAAEDTLQATAGRDELAVPHDLAPHLSAIDEVLVIAGRYRIYGDGAAAEFDHEEIDRLPHLADDLMRAISRLPAATADDFSARINLRGGTREETAVYLDGLKLIDPFHLKDLQGALSIVDSNLIDRVDVLPGGFPAIFGDQASGIISIDTLPTPDKPVYSVGVSFVNAFANTRGSFDDGHGGWLVSVRRGYLDWLFKLVDTGSGEFTPRYLDFLAKIEHDLGERHAVSGHVLVAKDNLKYFDNTENTQLAGDAKTLFLWSRLRSFWTQSLTSDMVLWRNSIQRTRNIEVDDISDITADLADRRDIDVAGLRSDWRWQLNDGWSVGLGAEATRERVDYDYSLNSITNNPGYPGQPPINRQTLKNVNGRTLQLYGSVRKEVGRLAAEFGWRRDAENYTGLDETVSSPRLNLRFDLTPETKLLLAWGDYYQFQPAEGLQVEDGIDRFAPAMDAEHRVVGLEHAFDSALGLRIDVYQKRYSRLWPRFVNLFDSYEPIPEAKPDRYRVDADSADARGIEVSLKRRAADGFSWWANYTYAKVDERIDGIDVPREWDQPHALNVVLNWEGARWNFNVASAWRSGWPRTQPSIGLVATAGGPLPGIVPGARNAARYDVYQRVDARVSRDVDLKRGTFTYFFEIYNLFDTANPCCLDEQELLPGPILRLNEENWLPRMPSFGFTWTFE